MASDAQYAQPALHLRRRSARHAKLPRHTESVSLRKGRFAGAVSTAGSGWLCDDTGKPTRAVQHICWYGCMFSNDLMMQPQTWNDVLKLMIDVRSTHGWDAPRAVAV